MLLLNFPIVNRFIVCNQMQGCGRKMEWNDGKNIQSTKKTMHNIEKSSACYEEMIKTDRKIVQIALEGRKDFNEKLTKL